MAERLAFRTYKTILKPVIREVPGTKAVFPALAARVWKDGNTVVLQGLFGDPRCFAARVHDDEKAASGNRPVTWLYTASHAVLPFTFPAVTSTPNIRPCRSQAVWASQADCRSWPPFANTPHSGPVVDTVLRTVPPPLPPEAAACMPTPHLLVVLDMSAAAAESQANAESAPF